ncbi:alkaline phosphatase family protein [Kribbia dieselivorans]|uniref:alkaline phosphatase family protein n=1 Tax=Kribbia dieselivorans TaxID=331526 RepID=UPI0008395490|nr:nucleotide pyrophosphatase/phosphodiesterase family protein [Kribbia dieselivorans]
MVGPFTPIVPEYGPLNLSSLLPQVGRSLGVRGLVDESSLVGEANSGWAPLVPVKRSVVVLVDGLGAELLARRGGHAPFLRSLMPGGRPAQVGFPSTTATSMGSFGTGLTPGRHGLVGWEVLDPATDQVFNELSWEGGPAPRLWQPHETVFQACEQAGVSVTRIGPGHFDGSGLTESALRGGRFVAAKSLSERVDATVSALRNSQRALVYLYWGDIDMVGHVHGCESPQWGAELESVDAELQRLARLLPKATSMHITADHGMVDVPMANRLDLAHEPDLDAGVRRLAGDPRAVQLHAEPGAADDVIATWRERLGERAVVLSREAAIADGWFGPTSMDVANRIGEIIVAMGPDLAVVDSRHHRPEFLALLGHHGSLTSAELSIPWLVVEPE